MLHACSFPAKLHAMLEDAASLGFDDVIAWQPGGESFKIIDHDRFSCGIMQKYFSQTRKLKSFQRQLNIYGFRRVHQGPNKGGYSHPLFNRPNPQLSENIVRKPSSRTKKCNTSSIQQQNFKIVDDVMTSSAKSDDFCMDMFFNKNDDMQPLPVSVPTCEKIHLDESEIPVLHDIFYPEDPMEQKFMSSLFFEEDQPKAVTTNDYTSNNDIQNLSPVAGMSVETELDNLLSLLEDDNDEEEIQQDDTVIPEQKPAQTGQQDKRHHQSGDDDTANMDHIFPFKLHTVLEDAEQHGFSHIISWVKEEGGENAFKVHDHKAFVDQIMPNYFDQTKYESFRRQLNLYGFERVSRGENRGVISHACFVRGDRSLCQYIIRQPIKGTSQ